MKLQVPNNKFQINSKFQITNSKRFGHWNFGHWKLFGAWKLGFGILLIAIVLLTVYTNGVDISITKDAATKDKKTGARQTSFLKGVFGNQEASLDPASGIFLDKQAKPSKEEAKEITSYFNKANAAVPLTSEALRFALTELILGYYDPLRDSLLRLEEGRLALEQIEPPIDALAFHKMSAALLREYRNVLSIPLTIPRDEFDPAELDDDFEKLGALVSIAKRELQIIKERYGIPLFPKSILFYDEAIGVPGRL